METSSNTCELPPQPSDHHLLRKNRPPPQALALGCLLIAAMTEPVSDRREQRILALVRSLNGIRRCDHDLERVRLQRERQSPKPEPQEEELDPAEEEARIHARQYVIWSKGIDDEYLRANEEWLMEAHPATSWAEIIRQKGSLQPNPTKSDQIRPNPTKSDQIRPNPTKSDLENCHSSRPIKSSFSPSRKSPASRQPLRAPLAD
jgi:hypothetical protein